MRSLLPLLLLVAACSGEEDGDDDVVESDLTGSTDAPTTESDPPTSDLDHTGAFYTMGYEGYATVAPGVYFEGQQALVAVWMKGAREPSRPRCIYAQELADWASARPAADDPLLVPQDRLSACPGCDFAFTVSVQSTVISDRFPWNVDGPPDVVAPTGARRRLDCDVLQNQLEFPSPEALMANYQTWQGVGFDADGDGDGDPNTGVVYVWSTRTQGVGWASGYEATFDPYTGQFHWYGFDRPLDFYY